MHNLKSSREKKIGFLLLKGTDVIYTHFWSIFKNDSNAGIILEYSRISCRCFFSLSLYWHWDMAVLAESMVTCKLQPQVFEEYFVIKKVT